MKLLEITLQLSEQSMLQEVEATKFKMNKIRQLFL